MERVTVGQVTPIWVLVRIPRFPAHCARLARVQTRFEMGSGLEGQVIAWQLKL